jgi:2-polyprenyl-3-methyl-5-hydroxy-6-metoxy-1,4-benzoquinol methylase
VGEEGREVSAPAARTGAWYDAFYRKAKLNPKHQYRLDPAKCIYAEMWTRALEWIGDAERILDIGCGPGQFAQMAIRAGKTYYSGVDFSREAVVWARERNPSHARAFDVCDLGKPVATAGAYDVAVLFEVLEHIDDDLGLLAKLRRGAHVILSVPNYGFTSHVRHFPKPGHAVARYSGLLTLRARHAIETKAGNWLWLFNAIRKRA